MQIITRNNAGFQCYCGTQLKFIKEWDYYIQYECRKCYTTIYLNFDKSKEHFFAETGSPALLVDKNQIVPSPLGGTPEASTEPR